MLQHFIQSPLEQFEIENFIVAEIFGLQLALTNIGFYFLLIFTIIIGLNIAGTNNNKIIPNRWSISLEAIYATIHNMVVSQINGKKGQYYFPLIFSLFMFILIGNLVSNVPYSFAVTSHLVFTISLSITIIIATTILGFKEHGLEFFSLFVPVGTPLGLVPLLVLIETVSYIARSISLGLRLGANLTAGHMLLAILSGFLYNIFTSGIIFFIIGLIPFALVVGIAGLEMAISVIQAYVFAILTCSYIKDALDLH